MEVSVNEGHNQVKIELLVAPDCAPCTKAVALWRQISEKHGLSLRVLDRREREGEYLSHRFHLKTFPALVMNGKLVAVGVQSHQEAASLLCQPIGGTMCGNDGAVGGLSSGPPLRDIES